MKKVKIIYGTSNKNKIEEFQNYLIRENLNIELLSLNDIGFNSLIIENGKTFEKNSKIKAKAIKKFCKEKNISFPIITDDAGLCCESLNGRPGVYTARYAGDHAAQDLCIKKLFSELKGKNRDCAFHCGMTLSYKNRYYYCEGISKGKISEKVGKLGGFTFGPVFVPEGYTVCYNEISDLETHRIKSIKLMIEILKDKGII